MKKYDESYFDLIRESFTRMIVTDQAGQVLSSERGLELWADKAREVQQNTKGLIFFCGNGASASMAEHMSHDWFQNAVINTTTCAETSHLTAIGNDIGYDNVFKYRIERILSEKDIFVGISSSGNSPNIVNALEAANKKGAFTITVSGMKPDNKIRQKGNLNFYVPLQHYGEVESAHAVLLHCALDYFLDKYMGERH